jgi:GGDEF domain-containing protein
MNPAPSEAGTTAHGATADLVAILATLADGLSMLTPAPEIIESMRALGEPGKDLPEASALAGWRTQLTAFVDEIRAARELRRQKAWAAVSAGRMDQATRLPGVTAAQAEIEKAAAMEEPPLLAVMALDQLRMLNARFGRDFSDQVLAFAATELSRHTADAGALFRWNGPAFVLVSSLASPQRSQLETKLASLANNRIDTTVTVENRSIHVKVTFSWYVHPLARCEPVIDVTRALDDLMASKAKAE